MPGNGRGFTANTFHDVAVTADRVDPKVEKVEPGAVEIARQPLPGNGHTDAVANTLAKGASGGFDAGGQV
jgi:hypothetical protein